MSKRNEEIVREFIRAWSDLDAAKLVEYFCEDGCYYNIPLGPVTGRDALYSFISQFLSTWSETEWEIRTLIYSADIVVAERLDKTRTSVGNVDLPCVGIFEMQRGKIKEWRDYFDMATYTSAMNRSHSS